MLNVSEQHFRVQSIRNKWFGEATSCPDMESGLQSVNTPITPANLWILFVLTASIYVLTALIHIGRKLHRSRQGLRAASHGQDFSTHVMTMIRSFKLVRPPRQDVEDSKFWSQCLYWYIHLCISFHSKSHCLYSYKNLRRIPLGVNVYIVIFIFVDLRAISIAILCIHI